MKNNIANWQSNHLYKSNNSSFREFEQESLKIFLKVSTPKKHIQSFFIRYLDEIGPHFRIRTKDKKNTQNFTSKISTLLNKKPINTRPIKNIKSIPYTRETNRYGGAAFIDHAENLFDASSTLIAGLLTQTEEKNYTKRLITSIIINSIFIEELTNNQDTISKLGLKIYEGRLFHILKQNKDYLHHKNITEQCKKSWDSNAEQLRFIINKKTEISTENKDYIQWRKKCNLFSRKVRQHFHTHNNREKNQFEFLKKNWTIFESIIHMNNNRLGIQNPDESFIGYAINAYYKSK